jgi:hypothetical protein
MKSQNYLPEDVRGFLELITRIAESNPFSLQRAELETTATGAVWRPEPLHSSNRLEREKQASLLVKHLVDCLQSVVGEMLHSSSRIPSEEQVLYRNAVWFWSYHHFREQFDQHITLCNSTPDQDLRMGNDTYRSFHAELEKYFHFSPGVGYRQDPLCMNEQDLAEIFAFCFQLRRGYQGILQRIIGISPSVAQLREATWEAIFTRRLLWSFQFLKDRMANFSTLILGKSGTGKDLVAETIGTSQYTPYHPEKDCFAINFKAAYRAVNLSALSPTLIESELFGHTKGAFTGATATRKGHLELSSPYGALFLDEIGDLSPEIQVKLLRVLQSREFFPLGERHPKRFYGRILSATNQEIPALVSEGRMRTDFLYRIGAIVIHVPTLSQRFSECPDEASELLPHFLKNILGYIDEEIRVELEEKIQGLLATGYNWHGNVREFEQCVRTLLVAQDYIPLVMAREEKGSLGALCRQLESSTVTLEELLTTYCRHVLTQTGTYQTAAQRLGVDWRTVKKYVEVKN